MKTILKKLRGQPEEVRIQILHILTLASAVVLILLWVVSLSKTITSKDTEEALQKDLQPFSVLQKNLVGNSSSANTLPKNTN